VKALAALPSLDELRAKLVGLIQAPATKIAQVLNAPGAKLAACSRPMPTRIKLKLRPDQHMIRFEPKRKSMADLQKIVDELSSLTVLEAAELAKMLEEKWGVSPPLPSPCGRGAGAAAAAARRRPSSPSC
jgi:hypothetical protein